MIEMVGSFMPAVLHTHRHLCLCQPPVVPYRDINEYHGLLSMCKSQYCALIHKVVIHHFKSHRGRFWSDADSVQIGLADFREFIEQGLLIILRLTKFRGLKWCYNLNQNISTVLNMTCRTYVHVNFMFSLSRGYDNMPYVHHCARLSRQADSCVDAMHSALIDVLTSERSLNSCANHVQQLFETNFHVHTNPSLWFAMPRSQWQRFLETVVCLLYIHLGDDLALIIMESLWSTKDSHHCHELYLQKRFRTFCACLLLT